MRLLARITKHTSRTARPTVLRLNRHLLVNEAEDYSVLPSVGSNGDSYDNALAETVNVLSSWAVGHGLPLGYGAALHIYGG